MAASVSKKSKAVKQKAEASDTSGKVSRTEKAASEAAEGLESSDEDLKSSDGEGDEEEDEEGRPKRRKKNWKIADGSEFDVGDSLERRKSSRTSVVVKSMEREALKALETPRVPSFLLKFSQVLVISLTISLFLRL